MCREEPITCGYSRRGGSGFSGVPGADAGEVQPRVLQPDHHEEHRKNRCAPRPPLRLCFTICLFCVLFENSASLHCSQVNWSTFRPVQSFDCALFKSFLCCCFHCFHCSTFYSSRWLSVDLQSHLKEHLTLFD